MQKLRLAILSVTLGLAGMAYAVCDSRTTTCLTALEVAGGITAGSVTNGGSDVTTGNRTTTGKMTYTPSSQVTVSTMVPISPTASTVMNVISTGGVVTFGLTSSYPAIATATATNGQYLVLWSTSTVSTISITTGTATAVAGSNPYIVLSSSLSAVSFIYNSTVSQWVQIGKQQ